MSSVKTQFYYNEPYIIDQQNKFYRCGQRIKEIRKDLELSPARFISWCSIDSESILEKIETENGELSVETLKETFARMCKGLKKVIKKQKLVSKCYLP
ncbi:MAG: hypothetical protein HPY78_02485 [Brevinematales bacterium]|nr:hypothetical protein [Brevinematales bacterium]